MIHSFLAQWHMPVDSASPWLLHSLQMPLIVCQVIHPDAYPCEALTLLRSHRPQRSLSSSSGSFPWCVPDRSKVGLGLILLCNLEGIPISSLNPVFLVLVPAVGPQDIICFFPAVILPL